MAEVIFYGASDDLVEFGGAIREEFNSERWRGLLVAPDGDALYLNAEFARPGAARDWTLWIENSGTCPGWPIRFVERPDYEGDPAIIIDVPEGTTIEEEI